MGSFDNEQILFLDSRYKKKDDCTTDMGKTTDKINQTDIKLASIETQQKIQTAILGVIGSGVIGVLIKMFFE